MVITKEENACLVAKKEKKEKTKKKTDGSKKAKRNDTLTCLFNYTNLHSVVGLIGFCFATVNNTAVYGRPSTIDTPLVNYHLAINPDRELTLTFPGFNESSEVCIVKELSIDPPIRVEKENWIVTDTNNGTLAVTITDIESHTGNYTIYDTTKNGKGVVKIYVHYLQKAYINYTGAVIINSSGQTFNTFRLTLVYDGPLVPPILDTYICDLESVPSVPDDGRLMTKILKFKMPSHLDRRSKMLPMLFGLFSRGARFSVKFPEYNMIYVNGTDNLVEGRSHCYDVVIPVMIFLAVALIVCVLMIWFRVYLKKYACCCRTPTRSHTDADRTVNEDPDLSGAMLR